MTLTHFYTSVKELLENLALVFQSCVTAFLDVADLKNSFYYAFKKIQSGNYEFMH